MKNIYIGGFLVTLLLVVRLFDLLLGSPTSDDNSLSQSVSFISAIENAPVSGNLYSARHKNNKGGAFGFQTEIPSNSLGIKNFASKKHFDKNYYVSDVGANKTKSNYGQVSDYAILSVDDETVFSANSSTTYSQNNAQNSQSFNSAISFQPGIRTSSNRISNDTKVPNHGFYALSTDLSSVGLDQLIAEGGMQKLSNPGDEPDGEPIPVGDGWVLMLIMAVGYGFYKYKLKLSSPV